MKPRSDQRAMTGRLWLDNKILHNRSALFGDWEVETTGVRLVGEATSDAGPFIDDWMLVLATGAEDWLEASMYAPDALDVLRQLGALLGAGITPELAGSTDLASRVLWPPDLVGRPVFDYHADHPRNFIEKIEWGIIGPSRNRQTFTAEVASYLRKGDGC